MSKLRHCSAIFALTLLASAANAGEAGGPAPPKYDAPSRLTPRASCPLTCTVMRVSTRCECPMGKTAVTIPA